MFELVFGFSIGQETIKLAVNRSITSSRHALVRSNRNHTARHGYCIHFSFSNEGETILLRIFSEPHMVLDQTTSQSEVESAADAEALVGVFETQEDAKIAIARLTSIDVEFAEVGGDWNESVDDSANGIFRLFYSNAHGVQTSDVASGSAKGAAIGAASGLIFAAVPVFNLVAPIAGMMAGALIGAMAGIDEATRNTDLPNLVDYQQMLAMGKGLVIINGSAKFRNRIENELMTLGATRVYQHPPILEMYMRDSSEDKPH
jgi:hypothetical protein